MVKNNRTTENQLKTKPKSVMIKMIHIVCSGGSEMAEIGNDKWISIDDAAEYLGVKSGTIRD